MHRYRRLLAIGMFFGTVFTSSAQESKPARSISVSTAFVRKVVFTLDAKLAAAHENEIVSIWELDTGKPKGSFPVHSLMSRESLAFSPDGKLLAAADDQKKGVILWDIDGKKGRAIEIGSESIVVFSESGNVLAGGSNSDYLKVWRVADGKRVRTIRSAKGYPLSFANEDNTIFVCNENGSLTLVDVVRDESQLLAEHVKYETIGCVALDHAGKTFALGSDDESIRLWDAKTGKPLLARIDLDGPVKRLAFRPNGKNLVAVIVIRDKTTGEQEIEARLIDLASGQDKGGLFKLPKSKSNPVGLTRDGRTLAVQLPNLPDRIFEKEGVVAFYDLESAINALENR
jgi:WD40 repeat protein